MAKNKFRRRQISAYRFLKSVKRGPVFIVDLDTIPREVDVQKLLDQMRFQSNVPLKKSDTLQGLRTLRLDQLANSFDKEVIIFCSIDDLAKIETEVKENFNFGLSAKFEKREDGMPNYVKSFYCKGKHIVLIPIHYMEEFSEYVIEKHNL